MSAHNVNLRVVLSDTSRIIKANRCHFLAISLLFAVPPSISVMYPSSPKPTPTTYIYNQFLTISSEIGKSDFIFSVICSIFKLLLSSFTTALITRSIVNGFFGERLKFASSIKSALFSILPLFTTYNVSRLILGLIFLGVTCLAGFMYVGMIVLVPADRTDFHDVYFLGLVVSVVVLMAGLVVYFQLEWYLADVIAVVESKRESAALRRSRDLVKGVKTVAFSMFVLFSLLFKVMSFFSPTNSGWVGWKLVIGAVVFAGLETMLRIYGVAATAVLFLYCRESRGEFDQLNVQLLYDDDDKAHKVMV